MRFLRPRQVLEMIGVSRTTLWRMVPAGQFPRPVCITERNRGYLLESVQAWMAARAEGRPFDAATTGTPQARGKLACGHSRDDAADAASDRVVGEGW